MKKAAIIVTATIVCGTLVGYLCMKDNKPAAQIPVHNSQPAQQVATTRAPEQYTPAFSPVVVPEHMQQHYTVNPKTAQVITGNSGTMLLIPDNAFADKSGNPVEGKVKLELVEAITREDLIEMNLGTMSDQGMLETGGSFYVGAKSESGEELVLAEGKTIEVEVPTLNKKAGMQIWEGKQNDDGSFIWTNPEPMKESLTEVPLSTLAENSSDSATVAINTPRAGVLPIVNRAVLQGGDFGWFDWARNLTFKANYAKSGDSIYVWQNDTISVDGFDALERGEAFTGFDERGQLDFVNFADKKFEHTNISTAEFRSRLPFIRQACDVRIAHCYSDYPNRALWKSDAAAADSLEKTACPLADVFRQFAKMKQDKVDPQDPNTTAALDAARVKAIENYSKRIAQSRAMYAPYKFGMRTLGWRNIDCMTNVTNPVAVNVRVNNIPADDNLTVTLLIPGRGICLMGYRMQNGDYSFGGSAFPRGEVAYILAKAGDDDNFSFALKEFLIGPSEPIVADMKRGTKAQMDIAMGNVPEEEKAEELEIIDDWYTQQIKQGGCVCGAWMNNAK